MGCIKSTSEAPLEGEDSSSNLMKGSLKERVTALQQRIVLQHQSPGVTNASDDGGLSPILVNNAIQHIWPYAADFAMKLIKEQVEPAVNSALPQALGEFKFETSNAQLGREPVQLVDMYMRKEEQMGLHHVATENLVCSMTVVWNASCNIEFDVGKINLRISRVILGGQLTMKLVNMMSDIPLFKGIRMFFANPPDVTFEIEPGGAVRNTRSTIIGKVMNIGIVKRHILEVMRHAVGDMLVLPNRMGVALLPGADIFEVTQPCPEGLLRFTVWRAKGLIATDSHVFTKATSDPYVQVRCGHQIFRCAHVNATLDPIFNYHVPLIVSAQQQQTVQLELYDKDCVSQDDFLGTAEVSMKDLIELQPGMEKELDLLDEDGEAGSNGTVTIGAVWAPTHQDMSKIFLHAMCVLSVGVYSASQIHCSEDTTAWVEVSCSQVIPGWPAGPLETPRKSEKQTTIVDNDEEAAKMVKKLGLLKKHGVPEKDIAEILEIEPGRLKNYEESSKSGAYRAREFSFNKAFEFLLETAEHAEVTFELFTKGNVAIPKQAARATVSKAKTLSHGKHTVQLSKFANDPLNTIVETVTLPLYDKLKFRLVLRFFDTPVHSTAADWISAMKASGHAEWTKGGHIDGDLDTFLTCKAQEWRQRACSGTQDVQTFHVETLENIMENGLLKDPEDSSTGSAASKSADRPGVSKGTKVKKKRDQLKKIDEEKRLLVHKE